MKIIGWTSFDSECQGVCMEDKESILAALRETTKVVKEEGYVFSGEKHQFGDCCVPVFDNGKCLRCSMRGWGIVMSIAHTGDESSYMDYYMDHSIEEEKLPDEEASEDKFVIDEEEGWLPYYFANQDVQVVMESASMGMQLMTFDKALPLLYDVILQEMQEEEE